MVYSKRKHGKDIGKRKGRRMRMDVATFSALAEPNRLRIVELLAYGPLTVGEIADRLRIRQPQASKHLRILLEAGLLEVQPDANRRHYRLRFDPLKQMDLWLGHYRKLWSERYDNLDDYLKKLQQDQKE